SSATRGRRATPRPPASPAWRSSPVRSDRRAQLRAVPATTEGRGESARSEGKSSEFCKRLLRRASGELIGTSESLRERDAWTPPKNVARFIDGQTRILQLAGAPWSKLDRDRRAGGVEQHLRQIDDR